MSVDSFLPWRLAQWNPTRGVWETGQYDLLSGLSELYSETWPTSGMTRGGVAFELPTPALPTAGSASSYLPTPQAHDAVQGKTSEQVEAMRARGHGVRNLNEVAVNDLTLLKTPTSQLAVNGGSQHPDKRRGGGHGPTLADEVEHLLPTPTVLSQDGEKPDTWLARRERVKAQRVNGNGMGMPLVIAAQLLQLGDHTHLPSSGGNARSDE